MREQVIKFWKRFLYLATIIVALTLGVIFMAVPFLPFGWLLIGVSLILLMPYFEFFRNWVDKLHKRDKSGRLKKIKKKITQFYDWCHDKNCEKKTN